MNSTTPTPSSLGCRLLPAGISDSDEDSDDGDYFVSGFSTSLRRDVVLYKNRTSSNQPTAESNSTCERWQYVTGWDENIEEDCEMEAQDTPEPETWGRSTSEGVRLACMRGDLEKLKELFSTINSSEVNQLFGGTDETPLMTSCMAGHYELVKYLLQEQSANPNTRDPRVKITPLMAACAGNADEDQLLKCVQALLEAGANPDIQNQYKHTALGIAIRQKRDLLARYLIENKADVNIIDNDSQSLLFYAAMQGNGRICRLLLEHGADIQLVDYSGWTAPEVAQENGFDKLADLLFQVQVLKWKPGMMPELMEQFDQEATGARRNPADHISLREMNLIELMLSRVDATKYFENFRKHKIDYLQFLNLDDNQLREIGIDEVGVRERILDNTKGIHKIAWQPTSLRTTALATKNNVTAAEAYCMIVNVRDQLEYIAGTLQYVASRINADPVAFQHNVEKHKIGHLLQFCREIATNSNLVRQSVLQFSKTIDGLSGYTELQIAGEIPKRKFQSGQLIKKRGKPIMKLGIGIGVLVMSLLLVKTLKNK